MISSPCLTLSDVIVLTNEDMMMDSSSGHTDRFYQTGGTGLEARVEGGEPCILSPDHQGATAPLAYLHQFVQHHGVEARQVLDVVALHHGPVLPDVSSELLHVEDQLCYVSVGTVTRHVMGVCVCVCESVCV